MRGSPERRFADMSMFRREGFASPRAERLRALREPTTLELRERFSALFAHLGNEEETLKNLMSQNEHAERQLQDLRHSSKLPQGFNRFDHEASELRQEALLAEQRCALQSGEAGALAAAAATYERQSARLQERCQAEASQERAATESLGRSASEIQQLTAECRELSSKLEGMEAQRQRVLREQQQVQELSRQTALKSKEVQDQLGEQRLKAQKLQEEVAKGREDLAALEKLVASKQTELHQSKRWLAEEREAASHSESRLRETVGKKTRYEEELSALNAQLEQCRKEGCDLQASFDETCREAKLLQERLRSEEQRHRSELEAAEASKAQKERLEAELKGAEGAKMDAEKELGDLRKLAADLTDHCSSQRRWRDEQLQKQAANELASERLRKEIQQLHAEQERLQQEAKLTMHKRNRLEVELQVARPALDDARRRCKDLEGRLVSRVRELSDESERVRRLQHEADMAKARLAAMDGQSGQSSFRSRQKLGAPHPTLKEPRAWRLLHGEEPGCWCGCSGSATAAASSRSRCAPFHCSHRRFHPCSLELRLADDARDGRALGGPRCRGLQCCTERLRERSSVDQGNEPSAALPSIVASRCHQLQHGFGELCLACSTQIYHGITGVPTRQGHSEHRGSKLGCLSQKPDTLTNVPILICPVHRGQWRLALRKLFKKGVSALDMFSLTIATSACEEAKSWSKALGLYALSHLCHARRDKLLPSANAAMSACTSQGCWPVAIEILQHMQRSRCRGDAITLGQCARSFQLGVLWLNALELLEGKGEGVTFLINRLRT
eukprot:s369_g26.t3